MTEILHVITGLGNGGAEAVLFRLIEMDRSSGNKHRVISLTDRGKYADKLECIGVSVHILNFPRGRVTISKFLKLLRILKVTKPDVVQTWMYHADLIGGIAARLTGISSIVWGIRHANLDPAHNSAGTLRVVRICARLSRWVPKKIITCSEEAMRLHRAAGYQAEKFVQIPNGYSMDRLTPDVLKRHTVRTELNVTPDAFVLGMVARFDVQKDHRNLIRALGLLKARGIQFTCLLVGVGVGVGVGIEAGNSILRGWIDQAGISDNVRLLGPRNDIPALMNAMDVHVLSSLGEAFPNVLAEAMACGTPCVTTDVGDASVIVGGNGWVVAPQDAQALANGLAKAYDAFSKNKQDWEKLQSACRAHIMANFELQLMCKRYRQVWKACMQD
ncbi:glycosyltransferase [Comamonadaceae bacterium OTU4NAUVB1]|nr:glycosyltransferase [Comamonadaceae bacterium OTU4NAUVB1]